VGSQISTFDILVFLKGANGVESLFLARRKRLGSWLCFGCLVYNKEMGSGLAIQQSCLSGLLILFGLFGPGETAERHLTG
jgi:hypothetical protein